MFFINRICFFFEHVYIFQEHGVDMFSNLFFFFQNVNMLYFFLCFLCAYLHQLGGCHKTGDFRNLLIR